MSRIDGAAQVGAARGTSLVMIGNFDGVHLGHQSVLGAGASEARSRGLRPLVLTFHPHPVEVLRRSQRALLTTIDHKIELIRRVDSTLRVVVEPFTLELAALAAGEFVERILVEQLGAGVVIVGQNFRFGADRVGDLGLLRELGERFGFEARPERLVGDEAGVFSSSRVRSALADGALECAERMLGRPHALSGQVVHGDERGRTLGTPTANLDQVREVLPPRGVYAGVVDELGFGPGGLTRAGAVANLGVRPTFGSGSSSVEVHVLGFNGDLYGARLRVHLLQRLRDERQFSGPEELREQIRLDVDRAARVIRDRHSGLGGGRCCDSAQ
jgi:riboflavin kinase/FMN adenylyltransferase